jgi:hypothetical protein
MGFQPMKTRAGGPCYEFFNGLLDVQRGPEYRGRQR